MGDEPIPMKPATPEQAVFTEALQRVTPEARAAYLEGACGADTALRRRVEALLRAAESAGDFLEQPPTGLAAGDGSTLVVSGPSEKPGDRIGRYKLLQQIGEGGCGVVYMAEQEEPVRRRVALKVIKLGMDTKSVIARFEAERQALALMDHPNIAKVLDAGATDTGRPFFVMELVRGIKITDYCDQNNLSTEERLKLFTQVCQAIQHAHQKGIIHRDIKPSNILVTIIEPGSPGCPKVIDFGIAKATTGQRLTDKTVFTAFEQFIGTPAYMSPEQAMMTSLDIDTRTDIYALGVLLYELLTGQTPFDAKDLMAAGLDAMRRIIREQEPARPSTRLSTLLAADLTIVASHRHAEPGRLGSLLRGDLDWIVMKALEKDRTRRYETANGLGMDIQRHLSNEPVIARPPSTGYRFQKLVRRNKLAFAAASAVTAALVIGLGISTWMFFKAQGETKKAQTEAAKATAISDFLQQLLRSANPDALKGSEYTVRQLLDDFSEGLANQLKDQPEVEAAVRATIGRAYRRLGVADQAQAHLERALTLRRRIFGEQAEPVAESLVDCAWTCYEQQQYAKGEPYVREALEIYRKRGTTGQPVIMALWALQKIEAGLERVAEVEAVTEEAMAIAGKSSGVEFPELASMIHGLAELKIGQSKYAEAEALALKAVEMHRRLRGAEHPETAWALLGLGRALRGQQKLDGAEAALREALQIFRKQYSSGHKSVDAVMAELKLVLEARGDSAALEALARERFADANKRIERNDANAEAWIERALGHADLKLWKAATADSAEAIARSRDANLTTRAAIGVNCLVLAQRAFAAAQYEPAERTSQQAITVFKQLVQENSQDVSYPQQLGHSQWQLGQALQNRGRPDQAEQVFLEALQVFEKASRNFPAEYFFRQEQAASHRFLGDVVNGLGRVDEAALHYRAAVDLYAALAAEVPQNSFYRQEQAYVTGALAGLLERAGRPDAAAVEYRQTIALYEKAIANFPNEADFRSRLVELFQGQGRLADAAPVLREALARQRKLVGNEHPDVANSLHKLGDVLRDSGQWTEAEEAFREAVAMRRKLFGNEHLDLAHSIHGLAWLLNHNGRRDEAVALSREELAMRRKLLGNQHPDVVATLGDLVVFLRDQGKLPEAETTIREAAQECHTALAQYEKLASDRNRHQECWSFAIAYETLGQLLQEIGQTQEAEKAYRDTQVLWRKMVADFNIEDDRWHLAINYDALGNLLREAGRFDEAIEAYRQALAVWKQLVVELNMDDRRTHLSWTAVSFAATLQTVGKPAEAEQVYREALAAYAKTQGIGGAGYPLVLQSLIGLLKSENKPAEAETLLKDLLSQQRQSPGGQPFVVALTLLNLADCLQAQNKADEAVNRFREALEVASNALADATNAMSFNQVSWGLVAGEKPTKWDAAVAVELAQKAAAATQRKNPMILDTLAAAHAAAGQFTNAVPVQQEAIALLQDEKQKKDYASRLELYQSGFPYRNYATLERQARMLHDQGKLAEAEAVYRELLPLRRKLSADDPQLAATFAGLTSTLLAAKKFAEAEPPARECLTIREKKLPDDWLTFNARSLLGGSLLGQKKYAEAEPLLISGYKGMKQRDDKIPAVGKPRVRETVQRLVQLYEATGQSEKAAEWKTKLAGFDQTETEQQAAVPRP